MTSLLFVYGTLMSGQGNPMHDLLARNAELVGPGRMRGRLFLVDDYPGLVDCDDPAEIVVGEVWRLLDPDVLRELDKYECCALTPPLFVRTLRSVTMNRGQEIAAWVYVYARSTTGLPPIPSGDWQRYHPREE